MRRFHGLAAVLTVLVGVYAVQGSWPRASQSAAGQPVNSPPLIWQRTSAIVVVPGAIGPAQPNQLTIDAPQTMLIPTEIPADSVKLLPNFTPPAPIRMLAKRHGHSGIER